MTNKILHSFASKYLIFNMRETNWWMHTFDQIVEIDLSQAKQDNFYILLYVDY